MRHLVSPISPGSKTVPEMGMPPVNAVGFENAVRRVKDHRFLAIEVGGHAYGLEHRLSRPRWRNCDDT